MVNKRDAKVFIVCLSCHFDVGLFPCHWARGTMTRTCLGPKSSSMRFGYSYSRYMRFSTYDLSSICFIFVLALTLTIQDAYDRGNESSKLV
jgi:hypothetical protein